MFTGNHYEKNSWKQIKTLLPGDGERDDEFGTAVTLGENEMIVGAYQEDGTGSDRGAAYIFAID